MADDVILPGTGDRVLSDERTIGGNAGKIQRVDEIGNSDFATGQVTATTTAATLVAARETRKSVTIVNHGAVDVFVGPATVTAANGAKIPPGFSRTIPTTKLVQVITATSTALVDYVETFDS